MPIDTIAYDAFVSYRHQEPDKTWVRRFFVPALETAGLSVCVDHRDFQLGAPLVTEMARAVEQSRTTVAVLTPAYLDGRFTELENVLAEHVGFGRAGGAADLCSTRAVRSTPAHARQAPPRSDDR
jgi:hypothetical protein